MLTSSTLASARDAVNEDCVNDLSVSVPAAEVTEPRLLRAAEQLILLRDHFASLKVLSRFTREAIRDSSTNVADVDFDRMRNAVYVVGKDIQLGLPRVEFRYKLQVYLVEKEVIAHLSLVGIGRDDVPGDFLKSLVSSVITDSSVTSLKKDWAGHIVTLIEMARDKTFLMTPIQIESLANRIAQIKRRNYELLLSATEKATNQSAPEVARRLAEAERELDPGRNYFAEDEDLAPVEGEPGEVLRPTNAPNKNTKIVKVGHGEKEPLIDFDSTVLELADHFHPRAADDFVDFTLRLRRNLAVKLMQRIKELFDKESIKRLDIKPLRGVNGSQAQGSIFELRVQSDMDNLRVVYVKQKNGTLTLLSVGLRRDLDFLVRRAQNLLLFPMAN